ncbi:MAG: CRTAC1 family protein [Vicinamibacterales bacterium]
MNVITRTALFRAAAVAALVFVTVLAWRVWSDREAVSSGPAATGRADATAPPAAFVDISAEAGLAHVARDNGTAGEKLLPETTGGGGGLVDVDNDGDLDLLLVNGRPWPWTPRGAARRVSTLVLLLNDGRGHFVDRSAAAGLGLDSYGMGLAAGDYDNDGWVDLYVTAVGRNTLLKNIGGRFHDVTAAAGLDGGGDQWSTCATWFDADTDGDLDLFVCRYVQWSRELDLRQDFSLDGIGRAFGPPRNFAGAAPAFFVNDGSGRFTERAEAAGLVVRDPVTRQPAAKSLGVALAFLDDDRCVDLVVANDSVRNFAFKNRCDGTFEEVGTAVGLAYDSYGNARSGMGIDVAEMRDDGAPAVAIGNFANEMTALYVQQPGSGQFVDEAIPAGIGAASRAALTFGLFFFDYDLDGRLDLLAINGHVEDEIAKVQASQQHAQPPQLFWNAGAEAASTFALVADTGGLAAPMVGRGGAYGDIDGDGDLDLLLVPVAGRPRLLRNDLAPARWLRVRLEGTASNRDAVGAEVTLTTSTGVRRRLVSRTHGYLSQSEPVLTFGLAPDETVTALKVQWPMGAVQTLTGLTLNQLTTVREIP